MPRDERRRDEHGAEHQRDGDQRAADLVHGAVRGVARGQAARANCARHSPPRRSRRRPRCRSPAPARTATGCSARSRAPPCTAKVPISETGMATIGMIDARQVCRNRMMTMTTRTTASKIVLVTSRDRFGDELGRVVDDVVARGPAGSPSPAPPSSPRSRSAVGERVRARALEDQQRHGRPLVEIAVGASSPARAELDPRRRRASRVTRPSAAVLTMMLPNWRGSVSRPSVSTLSWKAPCSRHRRLVDHARRRPARSARAERSTTSPAVMLRAASFSGSSQMRIA